MTTPSRRHSLVLLVVPALAATLLSACAPLIVGGAAVGGALVATDRRTSGAQLEDEGIELRAASRIRQNLGERVHVNATSYNRVVLLTGEVPTPQDKALVEQVVSRVDNVRSIINELGVSGNTSLTSRSSDALITGKVKALMVDAKDLFANSFKVVTDSGVVYLKGVVTQREATRGTEVARSVSGVQKVVRAFEIISEDELQRLQTQPPKPAPGASGPTRP